MDSQSKQIYQRLSLISPIVHDKYSSTPENTIILYACTYNATYLINRLNFFANISVSYIFSPLTISGMLKSLAFWGTLWDLVYRGRPFKLFLLLQLGVTSLAVLCRTLCVGRNPVEPCGVSELKVFSLTSSLPWKPCMSLWEPCTLPWEVVVLSRFSWLV